MDKQQIFLKLLRISQFYDLIMMQSMKSLTGWLLKNAQKFKQWWFLTHCRWSWRVTNKLLTAPKLCVHSWNPEYNYLYNLKRFLTWSNTHSSLVDCCFYSAIQTEEPTRTQSRSCTARTAVGTTSTHRAARHKCPPWWLLTAWPTTGEGAAEAWAWTWRGGR